MMMKIFIRTHAKSHSLKIPASTIKVNNKKIAIISNMKKRKVIIASFGETLTKKNKLIKIINIKEANQLLSQITLRYITIKINNGSNRNNNKNNNK